MALLDLREFPFRRVNAGVGYADGQIVTSNTFYNPVQDALALLYGGVVGRSASIMTEEFVRETTTPVAVGGAFGTELIISTGINAQARSNPAIDVGDHGVWKAESIADGAYDFVARDNENFIGTQGFVFTAKVRLNGRGDLESDDNDGIVVGLGPQSRAMPADPGVPDLPIFFGGSNKANWMCGADGIIANSNVEMRDDEWYWLGIARETDNNVRWYIKRAADADWVLVHTQLWGASLTGCRRLLRVRGKGTATAGQGLYIDRYAREIIR